MSIGLLALLILLLVLFVGCVGFYMFYIKRGTLVLVAIMTIGVWFLNFSLAIIFPFDVSVTKQFMYANDTLNAANATLNTTNATLNPNVTVNLSEAERANLTSIKDEMQGYRDIVYIMYTIIYWAIMVISWVTLPVLKEYERRGELTVKERFNAAVKANIMFYVYCGLAGLVVIIIAVVLIVTGKITFTIEKEGLSLYTTVIDASNLYGLSFIVVLMGYSFVKSPKKIFMHYNMKKRIKYLEFRATKIYEKLEKTKKDLIKQGKILMATLDNLHYGTGMSDESKDSLTEYEDEIKRILKEVKNKYYYFINLGETINEEKEVKTKKELVTLHAAIKVNQNCIVLFNCRLEEIYDEWYTLQSVSSYNKLIERSSSSNRSGSVYLDKDFAPKDISNCMQKFYISIRPKLVLLLIGLLVICSIIVILGECTLSFKTIIFIPSFILQKIDSELGTYLVIIPPLFFMLYECGYGLFRLRISKDFGIYGNKKTTSFSILFVSNFFCTVGFALTVHFGALINCPDTVLNTYFGLKFANANSPFKTAALYLPILIPVICFIMLLDIYNRVVKCCGGKTFDEDDFDGDETGSVGQETLMKIHKEKMTNKGQELDGDDED